MTFPDILENPQKVNVGLHTPEEMIREFKNDYNWNSITVVGNHQQSISDLRDALGTGNNFQFVNSFLLKDCFTTNSQFGIPDNIYKKSDGIVFDYNSYKLKNGTTSFLNGLGLNTINGYLVTNKFGETNITNLYAAGTVTTPMSGVPAAISSAQVVAFDAGRKIKLTTLADPSGRFPFFPREKYWEESWQRKQRI